MFSTRDNNSYGRCTVDWVFGRYKIRAVCQRGISSPSWPWRYGDVDVGFFLFFSFFFVGGDRDWFVHVLFLHIFLVHRAPSLLGMDGSDVTLTNQPVCQQLARKRAKISLLAWTRVRVREIFCSTIDRQHNWPRVYCLPSSWFLSPAPINLTYDLPVAAAWKKNLVILWLSLTYY